MFKVCAVVNSAGSSLRKATLKIKIEGEFCFLCIESGNTIVLKLHKQLDDFFNFGLHHKKLKFLATIFCY